ncbi:MAG: molecular chaperone TorD family protein [Chromatiales bacterium]|nr:molecular chaperone TorD family protein [Chromatiales bacterium]
MTGRSVTGRQVAETAALRCLCYAACSELLASPHEVDPRPALRERIGLGEAVPHARALDPLLAEVSGAELARLRAEYSGLFEVGSQGPPAPIREDLQTGQRAGTREEVVRFYDYFGYTLDDKFAWQPDHLSVELEFMHYLCYREAQAADEADALSFQLAQADFSGRHLASWVPQLAANVDQIAAGSLYARVVAAVQEFIATDHDWQLGTIVDAGAASGATPVRPESSPRVSGRTGVAPEAAPADGGDEP